MKTDDTLKVLLWSPSGAGRHYYGPGTNAYHLYRNAKQSGGLSVLLVHCTAQQKDNDAYDEVVQLLPEPPQGKFQFLWYLFKATRLLWKRRKEGYVFHGLDTYSTFFFPAVIASFLGYPTFLKAAAATNGFAASRSRLLLWLRKKMATRIDHIISLSDETDSELLRNGIPQSQILRIDNGVDSAYYTRPEQESTACTALRERLGLPSQMQVVLTTGAVVRRKQPLMLIEAFAALPLQIREKCHLVIVGPLKEPDYEQQMYDFTRENGITSSVHFEGYQSNVRPYYELADIYALLSLGEGMPNGALEAMSMELPLIITPFSSYSVLCPNNANGVVVANQQEATDALATLLENQALRSEKSKASRQIIEKCFSVQAIWQKYATAFGAAQKNKSRYN